MKLKAIFLAGLLCSFSLGALAQEDASQMNDDQLVAAAEKLIAENDTKKETKNVEAPTPREVEEAAIPAFHGKKEVIESTSSPWTRMILGGGVIVLMALGLLFGAKKFGKRKNSQNSKVSLDIISQRALSPKQNLLIVRVAGEHLLLGATDQSINLIKSVSLIDDETDGSLPQDFNNFLEDDFVEQAISGSKKTRTFTI